MSTWHALQRTTPPFGPWCASSFSVLPQRWHTGCARFNARAHRLWLTRLRCGLRVPYMPACGLHAVHVASQMRPDLGQALRMEPPFACTVEPLTLHNGLPISARPVQHGMRGGERCDLRGPAAAGLRELHAHHQPHAMGIPNNVSACLPYSRSLAFCSAVKRQRVIRMPAASRSARTLAARIRSSLIGSSTLTLAGMVVSRLM